MDLKDKIKELRTARKMSQKDLAIKLDELKTDKRGTDTYVQTISGWENGREPNLTYLVKLAKVFNVTTDYLLGLSDEDNVVDIMYNQNTAIDLNRAKSKISRYDDVIQEGVLKRISNYYGEMIKGAEVDSMEPWTDTQIAKLFYLGEFAHQYNAVITHYLFGESLISTEKDKYIFAIGAEEKNSAIALSLITELIAELIDVSTGDKSIKQVIEDREIGLINSLRT